MQVDPIKPMVKAPGAKRLRLKNDESLSNFDFNSNLRRYTEVVVLATGGSIGFGSPQTLTDTGLKLAKVWRCRLTSG